MILDCIVLDCKCCFDRWKRSSGKQCGRGGVNGDERVRTSPVVEKTSGQSTFVINQQSFSAVGPNAWNRTKFEGEVRALGVISYQIPVTSFTLYPPAASLCSVVSSKPFSTVFQKTFLNQTIRKATLLCYLKVIKPDNIVYVSLDFIELTRDYNYITVVRQYSMKVT